MTLIIGVEGKDGKAYVGGDRMGSDGYTSSVQSFSKVFRNGDVLLGYTGTFRMGQILEHCISFDDKPNGMSDDRYIANVVISAIINALDDNGHTKSYDGRKSCGEYIIGYNGKIYNVQSDFGFTRTERGYDCIGCGEHFALSSLYENNKTMDDPKKAIKNAIKTASYFCAGTVSKECDIIYL